MAAVEGVSLASVVAVAEWAVAVKPVLGMVVVGAEARPLFPERELKSSPAVGAEAVLQRRTLQLLQRPRAAAQEAMPGAQMAQEITGRVTRRRRAWEEPTEPGVRSPPLRVLRLPVQMV